MQGQDDTGAALGQRRGSPSRTPARVVLATGLLFGLAYLARAVLVRPGTVALNFQVYHGAAEAFLAGKPLYGRSPVGVSWLVYLYPPLSILAFVPFTLFPLGAAYALFTALSLAGGLALSWLLVGVVERHGVELARLDRLLVAGFVTFGVHTAPTLVFGQVNLLLALAVAVAFVALAAGDEARSGTTLALAAFVKVFPAGFGLWYLRQRSVRALGAAIATGGGLLVAGLALGPDLTAAYVTEALLPRASRAAFEGGLDPDAAYLTVRRPLSLLFPRSSLARSVGALAVMAPVVALGIRRVDSPRRRLVGLFVLFSGVLLALPTYPIYYPVVYFPLVPLLYLFVGPGRTLFLAGAGLGLFTLHLNDLRRVIAALGTPPWLHDALLAVVTPVFTVGSPALYALGLCLAGCLRHQLAGPPETGGDRRVSDER
ncbi:MAG: glycosyltransferase family 87 protein [Haloglomus sp.]